MDSKNIVATLTAVKAVVSLRKNGDPLDVILEYLGEDVSGSAARLALVLTSLCSEALNDRPDDPDNWLSAMGTISEIEDSTKDVQS